MSLTSQNTNQLFKLNPYDPQFKANPYPTYHYLRSHDPVHQGLFGDWNLTKYADVKAVLQDPRFIEIPINQILRNKNQRLQEKGKNLDALVESSIKWLFFLDPPDHTRIRMLVSKAFKAQNLLQKNSQIQEIADELISRAKHRENLDVISDFAEALPSSVIAQMLGLPDEDSHLICKWSKKLFHIFDPLASLNLCLNMNPFAQECAEYFQSYIAQRRQQPQSDLISALVTVEKDGEKLSDQEILSTCMMVVTAGMATTAAIIGNGMLAVLLHPEQLELLKNNPQILPTATEELLRYDSPTQLVARTPTETVEMGGKIMKPGENIIVYIGAANRDPAKFTDPDRLDLMRTENPHIAFAAGIHLCVGAALARIEVPIAINTLVQQLPNMRLATEKLEYHDYLVLRYLKSLPVTFDA